MICIDIDGVLNEYINVTQLCTNVAKARDAVSYVRNRVNQRVQHKRNIGERLLQVKREIQSLEDEFNNLGRFLNDTALRYDACEKNIIKYSKLIGHGNHPSEDIHSRSLEFATFVESTVGGSLNVKAQSEERNVVKTAFDFLGKEAGEYGTVFALGKGFFSLAEGFQSGVRWIQGKEDGTETSKNLAKAAKSLVTITKSTSKIADSMRKLQIYDRLDIPSSIKGVSKSTTIHIKRLLGLNSAMPNASQATSIGTRFKNNMYILKNKKMVEATTEVTSFGKAITKWAPDILDVALVTFDNISEYNNSNGEMSKTRLGSEIILESALTIAMGTAVGTFATAATAAVFTAGAPVIAVAAVSAGIVIGIDAASNALFGKGAVETVSDALLDTGEAATKMLNDIGNSVSENYEKITQGFMKSVNCFKVPSFGNIW